MKIEEMERELSNQQPSVSKSAFELRSLPDDVVFVDRGSGLEYMILTADGRYVPLEDWWRS